MNRLNTNVDRNLSSSAICCSRHSYAGLTQLYMPASRIWIRIPRENMIHCVHWKQGLQYTGCSYSKAKCVLICYYVFNHFYRDPTLAMLLPASTRSLHTAPPFDLGLLPRKLKHCDIQRTIVYNLIQASIPRTRRLLKSIDELEREVRDSLTMQNYRSLKTSYKCQKFNHLSP